MITSSGNARVKLVKSLGLRKRREEEGRFVAEGLHLVSEADAGAIDFCLFTGNCAGTVEGKRIIDALNSSGVETLEISEKLMKEVSEVRSPQGILAVVKMQEGILDEICSKKNATIIVCAGVQDPGNLGTIIRAIDASGAAGLVVSKGSVDVFNGKTVRASMSSIFRVPVARVDDVRTAMKRLKEKGVKLLAADARAKAEFWDADLAQSTAVVLGSEAQGLPDDIIKMCDHAVRIPMPGGAESLNVAVSASVILYEALRQRTKGN